MHYNTGIQNLESFHSTNFSSKWREAYWAALWLDCLTRFHSTNFSSKWRASRHGGAREKAESCQVSIQLISPASEEKHNIANNQESAMGFHSTNFSSKWRASRSDWKGTRLHVSIQLISPASEENQN